MPSESGCSLHAYHYKVIFKPEFLCPLNRAVLCTWTSRISLSCLPATFLCPLNRAVLCTDDETPSFAQVDLGFYAL